MPTPVKLGLAGGPLIISILIGRFGHKVKLVTYTTMSANLMLREVGLVLFLASVGIKAGENFVQMVVEGDGVLYVGLGFLITFIPLLITGIIARWHHRVNYFTLMGLIAVVILTLLPWHTPIRLQEMMRRCRLLNRLSVDHVFAYPDGSAAYLADGWIKI